MANRYMRTQFEPLEPRALLSHFDLGAVPAELPMKAGQRQALVGSIQGTENSSTRVVYYINASGAVSPLGEVTVTGSFGGGRGALNDKGTLTFTNSQGSLTLSLKTHGYFPLESQNEEEIRMTVQVRSPHPVPTRTFTSRARSISSIPPPGAIITGAPAQFPQRTD